MFFHVQNLGPLHDAEVDLSKDLIVLAGPNNSGKTYVAWSVYGLHRLNPTLSPVLDRWARQLLESPDHAVPVDELFAQAGSEVLDAIAQQLKSKLHHCFAADSAQFTAARVLLRLGDLTGHKKWWPGSVQRIDDEGALSSLLRINPTDINLTILESGESIEPFMSGLPLPVDRRATTTSLLSTIGAKAMPGVGKRLAVQLGNLLSSWLLRPSTLFPAERIAVNIFAKELALKRTELVDKLVDADIDHQADASMELVRRTAGRYPWPIRDSLKTANDLANLSRQKGAWSALADELENAVLGGAINVSDHGEMLFSPVDAADHRLQIHLTASVVKSLASLVFYFRYLAFPGHFIIIDEPELNLHPDNQRKVTRILTKAVRLGFKVMMSTHSDYVLRELNHMIMLSKLPADEARSLGYDPETALDPKRLGVYLFDERHAEEVAVEETGFSIKTIDEVVNQLNADEQRLYARLFPE